MNVGAGEIIGTAAIIIGFALTVIMFRVQRELHVQENHSDWPNWLAWADYLIVAALLLATAAIVIVLLASSVPGRETAGWPLAMCVAALFLQVGYVPAILAHYRIEIGRNRTGPRHKGEPAERLWVFIAGAAALTVLVAVSRAA